MPGDTLPREGVERGHKQVTVIRWNWNRLQQRHQGMFIVLLRLTLNWKNIVHLSQILLNRTSSSVDSSAVYSEDVAPAKSQDTEAASSTFITPSNIHLNMEHKEEDIAQLSLLTGKLSADCQSSDFMVLLVAFEIFNDH
jgi:hypothetical protein